MTDMWQIENELFQQGIQLICGVDEAGRGPLAGPVCAAAVILPLRVKYFSINGSPLFYYSKNPAAVKPTN